MKKIMHFLKLASLVASLLVLASCGGGGGGGSQGSAPIQTGVGEIFPGGNGVSPDANLVIVTQSSASTAQSAVAATQVGLLTPIQVGVFQPNAAGGTYLLDETVKKVPWISQYTAGCAKGDPNKDNILETDAGTFNPPKSVHLNLQHNEYGFCAATSMLMAAEYLSAPGLDEIKNPIPAQTGKSSLLGEWVKGYAGKINKYNGKFCGDFVGTDDLKALADVLQIDSEVYSEISGTPESWIQEALLTNSPVLARVHYQDSTCRFNAAATDKNNTPIDVESFYQGGNIERSIQPCYGFGHYVLIKEIGPTSVIVHDPDPWSDLLSLGDSRGGIRRYKKSDFLALLKNFPENSNRPAMVRVSASGKGSIKVPGYSTSANSIELSSNKSYTPSTTTPVATPLAPNPVFSASGLPSDLSMDTEGRIVGQTATTGTFSVTVAMRSVENGIERGFNSIINLSVKAKAAIQEALEFVTYSQLDRAKLGITYQSSLGVVGTTDAVSFKLVSGSLPPWVDPVQVSQTGKIAGIPTLAGSYSFDIEAATSTSKITKTFTLVVDPAPVVAPPAITPVLSVISPSPVTGMDGQQTVVLSGTGFSDGTRVELTDTTNGGTYQKVPVSINPAGTEITIRANFTSSPASWAARILGPTGLNSAPLSFSVVAPVGAAPVISMVTPGSGVLTAAATAQTITLSGTGFRTGAAVEITNLASGVRANAQVLTNAGTQITASYTFDTASMWGIRVINSDDTVSQSYDIQVKAPATITPPITPTATSPGSVSAPGTPLANTTASLSWGNVASATYYAVAVRDLNSGVLVVDTTVTGTSYALNLFSGRPYRWNVAACNSAGCSAYTAPLYFQTPAIGGLPDLVPQGITFPASATAGSSITISWTMVNQGAAAATTSNSVVRITSSNTSAAGANLASIPTGTIAAGSSISQSATVTVPGTTGTYYVWIIADNNTALTQSNVANDIVKAASSLTVSTSQTLTCTLPQVLQNGVCVAQTQLPGSLTISNLTPVWDTASPAGPAVTLNWSNSSGATSYEVYRNGAKIYPSSGTYTGTSLYNNLGLTSGQTYSYYILAKNSAGSTQSNAINVGPMPSAPTSVPGSFTLSNLAPVWDTVAPAAPAVTLNWTSSSGVTSYEVYRNGAKIYPSSGTYTGTSLYNNLGLISGQTYSYYILAINSAGSTQSNTINVGPMPSAPVSVIPVISSLSSYSFNGACSAQSLTIYGSNFVSGATVNLYDLTNNVSYPNRATTFNSSGQLTLSATYGGSAANWSLTVVNPSGSSSSSANFTVIGPTITSVSPNPVPRLNSTQTITFYGSGFLSGAAVQIDDGTGPYAKTPTVLSSGQMTISAYLTTATATWKASIRNCPNLADTWSPWFNF